MRIIRYQEQGSVHYGWVLGDKVGTIEGDPYGAFQRGEATRPLSELTLLPPVSPSKIICVGRNYVAHAKELGNEVPEVPMLFLKPPSSLLAPGGTIVLPPQTQQVEHEAELAVVIGKRGRWIEPDDIKDHILGYTIANDITARDLQKRDGQWTRGKGFDTFCPFGPWVETDFDPADAVVSCSVNGELRQMGSTRDMIFSVRQLLAYISSVMTLEPGDLVLTGTPAGVGPLKDGDSLVTSIEGLGELHNSVVAEPVR
ncbi:MAG TPA: fumarylacetoacetate hydrolase family protein [Anaerolineales bacterium]|nr:fumarylacetoacetate hydrolase family protein [Anaerolineales bacterium]HRQ92852.1 fumarylacetoacetate hydrolase family protein [Anaerolineales bacterium]